MLVSLNSICCYSYSHYVMFMVYGVRLMDHTLIIRLSIKKITHTLGVKVCLHAQLQMDSHFPDMRLSNNHGRYHQQICYVQTGYFRNMKSDNRLML